MGKSAKTEDILEFAIIRELEANKVFKEFARRMNNPAMRGLFEEFAQEELEHKAKLELEIIKIGKVTTNLKISDYKVYGDIDKNMDYKDALILAMEKEKASFRLYVDLASSTQNKESREVLLSLAEEEAKHKLRFELEYDDLIKKEGRQ